MRLALVISSLSAGGAQRVMSLLANYWAARGDEISLITLEASAGDLYELDGRIRRIALEITGDSSTTFSAVVNNYVRIKTLRNALAATGASVVLSFGDQTNVLVLLAIRGTGMRCVISERTDPTRHQIGRSWAVLRRLVYPFADALVVQTRALLPWAQALVGATRAHVIANPVRDLTNFTSPAAGSSNRLIVAMGRLGHEKGFDVLLRAFALVVSEINAWNLIILGEGSERGALLELIQKLGIATHVSLPGWTAEPGNVLSTASVFVMSSRYEGFPNALLEAMACEVAVVSTNCMGPADIITDEVDGLLVAIDSVTELANAMRRLMTDEQLRQTLGRNARTVSARYELKSLVRSWDALFGNAPITDALTALH